MKSLRFMMVVSMVFACSLITVEQQAEAGDFRSVRGCNNGKFFRRTVVRKCRVVRFKRSTCNACGASSAPSSAPVEVVVVPPVPKLVVPPVPKLVVPPVTKLVVQPVVPVTNKVVKPVLPPVLTKPLIEKPSKAPSLVEEQPKVEKPAEKTSPFTLTPKSKSSPPSLLVEEKENESFKLDRKLQIPGLNILPNEFVNPNAEKPKQRIF
tara:strand:+ start:735 stop:1358 length:624 start_codon:yes stop_codon:yes gene_type:complete